MVGKGSPRSNMFARGSPRFGRIIASVASSAIKKKKTMCSPKAKQRATWNHDLESSLIEILLEHKNDRGDNGWSSDVWNKMVKEFHQRNTYACYTKNQIQEKEGQLKRDYKMLKAARGQSGSSWSERRCMVEGPPHLWDNLEVSFPKIKKFRNAKASFPLYDACGELYDGHLAEGKYNLTSLEEAEKEPLRQIHDDDAQDLEEKDDDATASVGRTVFAASVDDILDLEEDNDGATSVGRATVASASGERRALQRSTAAASAEPKETKKGKKNSNIESMMGKYLEMRTKQAEKEDALLAKEKEQAQDDDFSLKRCVSVLRSMDVTKEERAKAYAVFKKPENREVFLCASEDDPESALIWLRIEMS